MFQLPSPLVQLHDDLFSQKKISFFIKRDDLIHPVVSGNKWRKLKFNMQEAQNQHKKVLLTVGGAFSNHLAATACAANYFMCSQVFRPDGRNVSMVIPCQMERADSCRKTVVG